MALDGRSGNPGGNTGSARFREQVHSPPFGRDAAAHLKERGREAEKALELKRAGRFRLRRLRSSCDADQMEPSGHLHSGSIQNQTSVFSAGALVDLPGRLISLAEHAGLAFASREVALLCGLRGEELVPRASFFQLHHQRKGVIERMLLAHEDVLVFTARKRTRRRSG